MKNVRTMGPLLVTVTLVAVVLAAVWSRRQAQRARYQNPYEFDVSAYKTTDPALLGYRAVTTIPLDFTPTFVLVHVVATATGIELAWDGGILIDATNNVVTLDNDGLADWATTNTVYVLAIE